MDDEIRKLHRTGCERIAGYYPCWNAERFCQQAIQWLADNFYEIRIGRDSNSFTVMTPEDDGHWLACCGESLYEALLRAVDSVEVKAVT